MAVAWLSALRVSVKPRRAKALRDLLLLAGVALQIIENRLLLRRFEWRQAGLLNLLLHLRHLYFPHRRGHRVRIVRLMALAAAPQIKLAGIGVLLGQRMLASGEREEIERGECECDSRRDGEHPCSVARRASGGDEPRDLGT